MRGLLALILVGCYAPSPPAGAPCAANGACPEPLVCTAGRCERALVSEDAPAGTDAKADASACRPITAGAGMLTAPRIPTPQLDGDLGDWPTCFVTIDPSTNPTRDLDGTSRFLSGRFAVAHDGDRLFIAADVEGIAPLGDRAIPDIYENNSISLYLDGDGSFTSMLYDLDAVQIVIDHADRMQAYRRGGTVVVPGVSTAVKTTGTHFTVEVALRPTAFGRTALASTMGFDIGFEGGDGTMQYSEAYWFQACAAPTCGCGNGMAAPYCDAREFGRVAIAP